uniref:BTB domain-containing protein n=1 Tax=Kalanchoe fedtschenkoi TaxID=63787 RepID=A0A7N0R9I8_KALFE
MDCAVCSAVPVNLRPPRNAICPSCYESARAILSLISTKQPDRDPQKQPVADHKPAGISISLAAPQNPSKGLVLALNWVKDMKEAEKQADDKIDFLGAFAASYRDQIHTDIFVKPGENGLPVPAHKALLAAKSQVFKHMLESDGCKAPPDDTITLHEFDQDELESLLEFLYAGSLPQEKLDKHVRALSLAADKYGIPYLQKSCEKHMLASLKSSNALDVLEISDACSGQTSLKDTALSFVVKNMEKIVFSARFESFALKNPHLGVQITRASFMDIKNRTNLS